MVIISNQSMKCVERDVKSLLCSGLRSLLLPQPNTQEWGSSKAPTALGTFPECETLRRRVKV